jgi:hypothetical protein
VENLIEILRGERSPLAFREIVGQAERADGDSLQGGDVVAGGGEHAADLVVAAFVKRDEGLGVAGFFEFRGKQRTGFGVEHEGAGGKQRLLVALERAVEGGMIDFQAAGLGVDDLVEQLAVVGHQQQAGGVLVEPAGGVEAWIAACETRGEQVVHRLAGILARAGETGGLVEHDDERGGGIEWLAAETDPVMGRQVVRGEGAAVVVGDGTGADEIPDLPAGAVAEIGEESDEFHGGAGGLI